MNAGTHARSPAASAPPPAAPSAHNHRTAGDQRIRTVPRKEKDEVYPPKPNQLQPQTLIRPCEEFRQRSGVGGQIRGDDDAPGSALVCEGGHRAARDNSQVTANEVDKRRRVLWFPRQFIATPAPYRHPFAAAT